MRYLLKSAAALLALAVGFYVKVSETIEAQEARSVDRMGDRLTEQDTRIDTHDGFMRSAEEAHALYMAGLKADRKRLIEQRETARDNYIDAFQVSRKSALALSNDRRRVRSALA